MACPPNCNCINCYQKLVNNILQQQLYNAFFIAHPWYNMAQPIYTDALVYKALAIWLSISGHTIKDGYSIGMTQEFLEELLCNDIHFNYDFQRKCIGFEFKINSFHGFQNPGVSVRPFTENNNPSADIILLALAKEAGGSFKIDRKYFTELLKDLSTSKVEIDTEQEDEFVHVRIK